MDLVQLAIAITGVAAAWINHDPQERTRRWACLIGLAGQPFWLWATWQAGQLGMLAVTVGYTVAFMRGMWVYWLQPTKAADA